MKGSFRQAAQRLKCWGGVALTALLLGGCSSDDADVTPGDGAMNVTLETEEVTSATVRIVSTQVTLVKHTSVIFSQRIQLKTLATFRSH